jgi:hypothetical protein
MLKIKRTTQLVVRDVPYIMHPKKAIQALRQRYGVSDHRDFASSHSHEQFKTHSIDFPYVRASDLEEGRITVLVSEAQHYAVDSKGTVRNFLPSNLEFKVRHLLGQPRKENIRQEQDYFAEVKALLEDQYPIPLETAKVAEKPKDSLIGGPASGGSGSYSTPKPVKLEFDKEVALDYWESQKDNADNFPEYFLAHMMGLNTKIGYGFAEGVANTIDTIKDPEKLKEAVSGTVNGVINTVTHPAQTLEALEKSAIEFRDLPTQQQAEILYTLGVSSLVGGRLLKRKGNNSPDDKSQMGENDGPQVPKDILLARRAKALELADGGHSLLRHGPEVSDDLLRRRALTGISPDNKWSPTHYSTKFDNYDDWLKTRDEAILSIQQENQVNFGANMDRAPEPGASTSYSLEINHDRPIDSGFNGTGPRVQVVNPNNPLQSRNLHTQVEAVSGITKSYTKVAWDVNASRWKVVQHFPVGKNWNQALQRYDS